MSKPRSKLIDYKNTVFRTAYGYPTEVHFGRQAKHMPGQTNYDPTKSTITISIVEVQVLLEHHAGTGYRFRNSNKEIVDFGVTIGVYRPDNSDAPSATRFGIIHYSEHGAHIVPANPNQKPRRRR